MPTISETLAIAFQHHQAGQLNAAEQIYRQVLAVEPNHPDALHLLGVIALQEGHHERAVEHIQRAIDSNGTEAGFHCNLGNAFQGQGKLEEAIASFRRAVELRPDYAVAHGNLGNTLRGMGKLEEAIACFRRLGELKPDSAEAHSNLANALQNQGRLDEAIASYSRALELNPDHFVGHYNLANALQGQGEVDKAIDSYRRAVALLPDHADTHSNLGAAFKQQRKLEEAVASYRRALELKPDCAIAHYNLGVALRDHGKTDDAVGCHRRAIELNPEFPEAHNELGNAFMEKCLLDEAHEAYRRALELKPDFAEAHNNLGGVFHAWGKLQDAQRCYERALELKPGYVEAHLNLGGAYQQLGRFREANLCYDQALELNSDCDFAHLGRSMLNLLTGNFESGWPEFESRWKTIVRPHRKFLQPRWDGNPLSKRTILLHAEESLAGFGDTILFVRYAVLLKQQYAAKTVVVECQRPLAMLLASCCGIDQVVAQGDEFPSFDVHAPLLSLPGIVTTTLATVPAEIPYLFADPVLVCRWREKLKSLRGLRIGIHWRGKLTGARHRDIPLECFESLAGLPGVRCISLQKGTTPEELAAGGAGGPPFVDLGDDFDTTNGAFMDTAAIMMNLDLVITSDTSIPHLAGALGVPVWLGLPFVPDWRWLLERSDSPWYPTMRLFRQKQAGDWASVFDEIREALQQLMLPQ